jgi:hypothetical protein
MPFVPSKECSCCQESLRKFAKQIDGLRMGLIMRLMKEGEIKVDNTHCEDCWDNHHNKGMQNDFEEKGRFKHLKV